MFCLVGENYVIFIPANQFCGLTGALHKNAIIKQLIARVTDTLVGARLVEATVNATWADAQLRALVYVC